MGPKIVKNNYISSFLTKKSQNVDKFTTSYRDMVLIINDLEFLLFFLKLYIYFYFDLCFTDMIIKLVWTLGYIE